SHHGLSVSGFNYYRYSIEIPDSEIERVHVAALPKNWNLSPAPDSTRTFAEKNLFLTQNLAIAVPSVVIPEEYNLVVNPLHSNYPKAINSIQSLGQFIAPVRD